MVGDVHHDWAKADRVPHTSAQPNENERTGVTRLEFGRFKAEAAICKQKEKLK